MEPRNLFVDEPGTGIEDEREPVIPSKSRQLGRQGVAGKANDSVVRRVHLEQSARRFPNGVRVVAEPGAVSRTDFRNCAPPAAMMAGSR